MTDVQKRNFNVGQGVKILIGLAIIAYGVANSYFSLSAEAMGFNFVMLVIVCFGLYLVISGIKPELKINKIFKYLGIACIAIIVICMIIYAVSI